MTVNELGGELDAFKIGSSAGLRFLKKYGIQGYTSSSHQFFNSDGLLIDEDGLRSYLVKTYSDHYRNTDTLKALKGAKLSMINTKINLLKGEVETVVKNLNRPDLQVELAVEISALEKLKSEL
jgi:hypothetical protein